MTIYDTKTAKPITSKKEAIDPDFSAVHQTRVWDNPLQARELIFQSGRSHYNSHQNRIIHLNSDTYQRIDTITGLDQLRGNLLGVDRHGNYYLSDRHHRAYQYDRVSMEVVDTLAGDYYTFYSRVHATSERDVMVSKQGDRVIVYSPSAPDRYQFLPFHEFVWVGKDLNYLIQTVADQIRIYRWRASDKKER